MADKTVINLHD